MRRIITLLALVLVLASCGGDSDDSSGADGTEAALPETTVTDATTTTSPPTTTAAPTTEAPDEATTTTGATSDSPFDIVAATPPAVFDSFVSTLTMTMGFEEEAFEMTADGSWTGDAFECTMTMNLGGLAFSQSVVGTADTIWFDDGTGFEESTINTTTQDVVSSCGASPSFWEDFVNPGVDISGDTEQFAGRPAVKVDLREMLDYTGNLGMVQGVEDAVINKMDMWIDQETNVVLGLSANIAMDAGELGDLGLAGDANSDTVALTMDLALDRINDPSIAIAIPGS